MPSANSADFCAMYGLIQTQMRRPCSFSRASMPSGSGKTSGSQTKSHHWYSRIQKQSKWKTLSGISALGHAAARTG